MQCERSQAPLSRSEKLVKYVVILFQNRYSEAELHCTEIYDKHIGLFIIMPVNYNSNIKMTQCFLD